MRKPAIIVGAGAALVLLVALALGAGRLGLVCLGEGAGGPGTTSAGPVMLATDHAIYASSDAITVTITNHLDRTIYVPDGYCGIVVLEQLEDGHWSSVNLCPKIGDAPPTVNSFALHPDASLSDRVSGAGLDRPLAVGTYHLSLIYFFSPLPRNSAPPVAAPGPVQLATSATIRVCTCRSC